MPRIRTFLDACASRLPRLGPSNFEPASWSSSGSMPASRKPLRCPFIQGVFAMSRFKAVGKDHIGAVLLIAMGAGAFGLGLTYRMGTLNHMGAGYVPVVLGVLMVLVGLAIGLTATPAGHVAAGSGA